MQDPKNILERSQSHLSGAYANRRNHVPDGLNFSTRTLTGMLFPRKCLALITAKSS